MVLGSAGDSCTHPINLKQKEFIRTRENRGFKLTFTLEIESVNFRGPRREMPTYTHPKRRNCDFHNRRTK